MITVRGDKIQFKGEDARKLRMAAQALGLSPQEFFVGVLWERIMQLAREGLFLKGKKK